MDIVEIKIVPFSIGEENASFVELLKNMYELWASKNKHQFKYGNDSIIITGNNLEQLIQEHGVHRLCRTSLFDKQKRRHTTYCTVLITINSYILESPESNITGSIRHYTLTPYCRAKNTTNDKETTEVDRILSGEPNLLWD